LEARSYPLGNFRPRWRIAWTPFRGICVSGKKGRADRAFCIVNGQRHALGRYGSEESRRRYAELLAAVDAETAVGVLSEPADRHRRRAIEGHARAASVSRAAAGSGTPFVAAGARGVSGDQ